MAQYPSPDRRGLEELYQRHWQSIYRICYTYMKNPYDAEDCTEDAFVRAIVSEAAFENEKHERAWLAVTAIRICKDRLKHWWNHKVVPIEDYEDTLQDQLQHDDLLDAVLALPAKYKDVLYLHYYEGYQTDEIAAMLKRPASTVRNQLRDARKKLKQQIGDDMLD